MTQTAAAIAAAAAVAAATAVAADETADGRAAKRRLEDLKIAVRFHPRSSRDNSLSRSVGRFETDVQCRI